MKPDRILAFFLAIALLLAPAARAQLVADGATNTLNNVTNNLGSTNLVIGTNGPNTALILTNNGTVIATNLVLGLNAGATNSRLTVDGGTLRVTNGSGTGTLDIRRGTNVLNAGLIVADNLLVTNATGFFLFNGGTLITRGATISNGRDFVVGIGPGTTAATWDVRSNVTATMVGTNLTIGSNASGNTLLITNGATLLSAGIGRIGRSSPATNNLALISGAASFWSNAGDLFVGGAGSFNRMILSNGGRVSSDAGRIGNNLGGTYNSVVVTGAGSVWSNRADLTVGNLDTGNSLLITNGGTVVSSNGVAGSGPNASSNVVTITGAGSLWSNTAVLFVGASGAFNSLLVTNGGTLASAGGVISSQVGADSNQVIVAGPNSRWNNSSNLSLGASGTGNTLLISGGGVVADQQGVLGFDGSGNWLTVTGAGSRWSNGTDIVVGENGSANLVTITNGGVVTDGNGLIGHTSFASSNQVIVTGTGSVWSNSVSLQVGVHGSRNTLLITNGGTVFNAAVGYLGVNYDSIGNVILVTGAGSLWTNGDYTSIGSDSASNTLRITAGGRVADPAAYLGDGPNATRNLAVVDGAGSVWAHQTEFAVGFLGSGNTLLITNGGLVTNLAGILGYQSNANGNVAIVTGAGSLWTNRDSLTIGNFGGANQLLIANGGRVVDGGGYLGSNSVANNNLVTVTGPGSLWANSSNLSVGYSSSGNQLVVSNGGVVANIRGYLGFNAGANSNVALVTGAGSLWTNSSNLYVGASGSGNQLTISSGGAVQAANANVSNGGSNNQLTIANGTLILTNADGDSYLAVGPGGSFVFNGGNVTADLLDAASINSSFTFNSGTLVTRTAFFAHDSVVGAFGNGSWTVNGSGMNTTIKGNLILGGHALGNSSLLITNGAWVSNYSGTLGSGLGEDGNLATVTGAGSAWTNRGDLTIGDNGSYNQLTIANGGKVADTNGILGNNGFLGGNYNQALVTGAGSLWNNDFFLIVGNGGGGNSLVISNGGFVTDSRATIGGSSNSFLNQVTVTGSGSAWNNYNTLFIGSNGSYNTLLITNGGQESGDVTIGLYSGATSNLLALGNGTVNGIVTVNPSNTLAGTGEITDNVGGGGIIAPGTPTGQLNFDKSLTLYSTAVMSFDIGGLIPVTDYDQVTVGNLATFAGTLSLNLLNGYHPAYYSNVSYTLMTYGSETGTFANAANGAVVTTADGQAQFTVNYNANSLVLSAPKPGPNAPGFATVAAVPGKFLVNFKTSPTNTFIIQYSSDLSHWTTVTNPVLILQSGSANWADDGSQTGGLPANRSYRVLVQ